VSTARHPDSGGGASAAVTADTVLGSQQGDHNTQNLYLPGREPRRVPRRFRFRLPRPAATFTARGQQLAELDHRWPTLGSGAPAVQVLTGLPGVGKTQLAAAYVQAHVEDYDLVAWVRAADPLADLADLADQLRLTELEDTVEQRAERTVMALAAWDSPWLLVFDNVEDPAVLQRWCPSIGPGRVLVTARHRRLAPDFGPELHLGVFELDEATAYLLARSQHGEKERAAAEAVATALGRLPLALAHAGAYCAAERGTSFTDYLALLDALPAAELFDSAPEAFYTETVASTWATSIAATARRAPLAADVLNLAAVLDPDAIPLELFGVLVEVDTPSGAAGAQHRLNRAVAELCAFSLADVTDGQLTVHRLLQKVVRDELNRAGDTRPVCQAVVAVAAAFPADVALPESWPSCRRLVAHVQAVSRQPESVLASCAEPANLMLNYAVVYLHYAGDQAVLASIAPRAVDLATALLGAEHPDTLAARDNLALSYWSAGRIADAIALQEQVLADRERLLGPEHPDTLTARTNLATSYWSAGRTADAIALQEQVLADRERLLGPEHPDTLTVRNNLATSYYSAGRIADAIALQERVLADRERLLGPEHPDTLTARTNLATSYGIAGRSTDAIALLRRVLADRERLLGPEHPDTLGARNNLALSYYSAGRIANAIALQERVLTDFERLLGPEHPDTLTARANLATSYYSAGRIADAMALQERVLTDRERLLGLEHPDTVIVRANLASSYYSAGRNPEAVAPLLEQVLADCARLLGPEHPDTLTARANLALSYYSAGRIADAKALQQRVLADSERLLGPEHPHSVRRGRVLQAWRSP
jgi:tetratricopeptide (TPR) repeat protein